jgi:hypothetical protein
MIHAFVAGFAGCIGVLVALWCWNSISERRARQRMMAQLYPPPPRNPAEPTFVVSFLSGLGFICLIVLLCLSPFLTVR